MHTIGESFVKNNYLIVAKVHYYYKDGQFWAFFLCMFNIY